jgi:hypothetical protein
MTDPTNKPLYVRCNGCQQAVPNRKLDVDAHKLNCPHDIKLALQKALERISDLEGAVEHVEELATAEPASDIDSVGEWPGDDPTVDDQYDDDEEDLIAARPAPVVDYFQQPTTLT